MKLKSAALLVLLLFGLAGNANAESDPKAVVQTLNDRLIEVMKHGSELGFKGREDKLRPVVSAVYDMTAMTKSTLGLAGAKLSPEDAAKLAEAYTRYSVATYAEQFNAWSGERFEVDQPRAADNGQMLVPSWIVAADGSRTSIDYLMHDDGGSWRIVDVLFDGAVSQVAVRRSEFVPIFRRDGLAALIAVLDNKAASLGHP